MRTKVACEEGVSGVLAYPYASFSCPTACVHDLPTLRAVARAVLFGAAGYTASRLTPPATGTSQDDWWRINLGRAIGIWTLVEAPTLLGTTAYLLTHDFRTLIATLTGLLLFVNYRPSRLTEV